MLNSLQDQMLVQMQHKQLLEQAKEHAFFYVDDIRDRNVFPTQEALQNLEHFYRPIPERIGNAEETLQILNRFGTPATVAQTGGRYFGMVNGNVLPVALAARWLADVWDQNAALFNTSPLAATLETVCETWLRELLGLPSNVVAGFVSGSSMAIVCGLTAARYRLCLQQGWDVNAKGFNGAPTVNIVAGRHAHSSVVKAIALLGFGTENINWVDVDAQGRIIPEAVPELDAKTILFLQAGNVGSGAFDPFPELCDRARQAGAWVHIDGAFGLWAAACGSLKYLTAGMETANSFSLDGHKTLNTPYDNGIVLCSDKDALISALQVSGAYIVRSNQRDSMFYVPEMSRRARGVELWAALHYLGREGVDQLVLTLHQRALDLADQLRRSEFHILNDVVFNQIMVACENDTLTTLTMEKVQESGECWAGSTDWQGKRVIRISICSWSTTKEDVVRTVNAFVNARKQAREELNKP